MFNMSSSLTVTSMVYFRNFFFPIWCLMEPDFQLVNNVKGLRMVKKCINIDVRGSERKRRRKEDMKIATSVEHTNMRRIRIHTAQHSNISEMQNEAFAPTFIHAPRTIIDFTPAFYSIRWRNIHRQLQTNIKFIYYIYTHRIKLIWFHQSPINDVIKCYCIRVTK